MRAACCREPSTPCQHHSSSVHVHARFSSLPSSGAPVPQLPRLPQLPTMHCPLFDGLARARTLAGGCKQASIATFPSPIFRSPRVSVWPPSKPLSSPSLPIERLERNMDQTLELTRARQWSILSRGLHLSNKSSYQHGPPTALLVNRARTEQECDLRSSVIPQLFLPGASLGPLPCALCLSSSVPHTVHGIPDNMYIEAGLVCDDDQARLRAPCHSVVINRMPRMTAKKSDSLTVHTYFILHTYLHTYIHT